MILRERKGTTRHAREVGKVIEIAANLNRILYELERNGTLFVDDMEDALHVVHVGNVVLGLRLLPFSHAKNQLSLLRPCVSATAE